MVSPHHHRIVLRFSTSHGWRPVLEERSAEFDLTLHLFFIRTFGLLATLMPSVYKAGHDGGSGKISTIQTWPCADAFMRRAEVLESNEELPWAVSICVMNDQGIWRARGVEYVQVYFSPKIHKGI